jgi:hypothetical protein
MTTNEFVDKNKSNGISSQTILDAGLNVFALQLLIESFTDAMGHDTSPIQFQYRGVNISLQIADNAWDIQTTAPPKD